MRAIPANEQRMSMANAQIFSLCSAANDHYSQCELLWDDDVDKLHVPDASVTVPAVQCRMTINMAEQPHLDRKKCAFCDNVVNSAACGSPPIISQRACDDVFDRRPARQEQLLSFRVL